MSIRWRQPQPNEPARYAVRYWQTTAHTAPFAPCREPPHPNGQVPSVPVGCYSILLARLQGEQLGANTSFAETREQLNQKLQSSPGNAPLLSQLAVVDALLSNKEVALSEAKHAAEMLPLKQDALDGPGIQMNLAVVYAWTGDLDLAFSTLSPLTKTPGGAYYGELKRDPYWDPLRKDPRFGKLLAELAPRN